MKNLSEKCLHIVAFDIPYPPNYGGAIDIFFKIKALAEKQIKIILHAFEYGNRKPHNILNEFCHKVYYYHRKIFSISNKPYIVATRNSKKLLRNLLADEFPILFEGLHCCYFLKDEKLKNRKKFVRLHNIEHHYYKNLAKFETNILKRLYFNVEAKKLEKFEKELIYASGIAAISYNEFYYLRKKFSNVEFIGAFHQNDEVNIKAGKGDYALYHGNLSVNENNAIALFLVNEVFNDIEKKLIIAGNNPSDKLIKAVKNKKNIQLLSNIDANDIAQLIKEAHINILPSFTTTGIKLKLLNALYQGRFCLVNPLMIENTGLDELCIVANNSNQFKILINELFKKEFTFKEINKRKKLLLEKNFNNERNADRLIKFIFS